jgi:hypothetical protein
MFRKQQLDSLYRELDSAWRGKPEYEQLLRDAHLGIAYSDAGRPLDDIDPRIASLIDKHKPGSQGPAS